MATQYFNITRKKKADILLAIDFYFYFVFAIIFASVSLIGFQDFIDMVLIYFLILPTFIIDGMPR